VVAAQLVSKVAPIYPQYAQEKGIEGPVLLEAVISTDGSVLSLKVVNTADADLARAATAAVQQWHYQPTLLNGQPVEVVTAITVDFRLTP
jgi:protein TonB